MPKPAIQKVVYTFNSSDPVEAYTQQQLALEDIQSRMDASLKEAAAANYSPAKFAKEVNQPVSNIRRAFRLRGLLVPKARSAKSDKAKTAAAKQAGRVVTTKTHIANGKAEPKGKGRSKAQPDVSTKAGRRSLAKKAS